MSRRLTFVVLPVLALVGLGCGSSSNKSTTGAASTPSGTTASPSRTYNLKLAGKNEVPAGAATGSGRVVISLRGKTSQVCWKFSGLKNVPAPTAAHIHMAPAGTAGPVVIPLGATYTAKGCTAAPAKGMASIVASPKGFYVNVHNAKYPNGAVRAQI